MFSFSFSQTVETIPSNGLINDGLIFDDKGNLYGSQFFGENVTKVTPDGQHSVFANGFTSPNGTAFDSEGTLWIPSHQSNQVYKVKSDGSKSLEIANINTPSCINFDSDGNMFITHYGINRVSVVDTTGNLSVFINGGGLNGPIDIEFDADGIMYVANYNDGKIFKVNSDTTLSLIAQIEGSLGFMVLADSLFYATGITKHTIYTIHKETGEISWFAGGGLGGADGTIEKATFNQPNGIAITPSLDTLYISGFTNNSLRRITGLTNKAYLKTANYSNSKLTLLAGGSTIFDSVQVLINGTKDTTFANITETKFELVLKYTSTITKEIPVRIYAFLDEMITVSNELSIVVYSFENPVDSYLSDFEDAPIDDFVGDLFSITRTFGFSTAIHSKHYYLNSTDHIFTLVKPIIVKDENARMIYSDVAIVEPGEEGSEFGDLNFKDYVVVEASKDGEEWKPLAPGYDSRLFPEWENAWTNAGLYRKLFKQHSIDLSETFNAGDTILIRFRLFADDQQNGWGWVIDSLQIQDFALGLDDFEATVNKFSLGQNYPNPFNPTTNIQFRIDKNSSVSLNIYDNMGRLVKTIYKNEKMKAGVLHSANWDGKNNANNLVASGTYYYKLITVDKSLTKKMLFLK